MNSSDWRSNVPVHERTMLWQRLLDMLNRFPTSTNESQVMSLAKNFEEKVWNRANSKEEYLKLMMTKFKKISEELAKQNLDNNSNAAKRPQPPSSTPAPITSPPTKLQALVPSPVHTVSAAPILQAHSGSAALPAGQAQPPLPTFPIASAKAPSTPQLAIQQQQQPPHQQPQAPPQTQSSQHSVPIVQYPYGTPVSRLHSHEPGFQALQARAALAQQQQQYLLQQQLLQRQLQSSNQVSPHTSALPSQAMHPSQPAAPSNLNYYNMVTGAVKMPSATPPSTGAAPSTTVYPPGTAIHAPNLEINKTSSTPVPPSSAPSLSALSTASSAAMGNVPPNPMASAKSASLLTSQQALKTNFFPAQPTPSAAQGSITPSPQPAMAAGKKPKAPRVPKAKPAISTKISTASNSTPQALLPQSIRTPSPAHLAPPEPPLSSQASIQSGSHTASFKSEVVSGTAPPSSTAPSLKSPSGSATLPTKNHFTEQPLAPKDISKMGQKTQEAFLVYQELDKVLLKLASTTVVTEAMRNAARQKRELTHARLRKHFELLQRKMVLMNFEQLSAFTKEMQRATLGISALLRRYETGQGPVPKEKPPPSGAKETPMDVDKTEQAALPAASGTMPSPDPPVPPPSSQPQPQPPPAQVKVIQPAALQHRLPKRLREQREKELSKLAHTAPPPGPVTKAPTPPLAREPSPPPSIDRTRSGLDNLLSQFRFFKAHVAPPLQKQFLAKCFGGSSQDWLDGQHMVQWTVLLDFHSHLKEEEHTDFQTSEYQYLEELEIARKKSIQQNAEECTEIESFNMYSI